MRTIALITLAAALVACGEDAPPETASIQPTSPEENSAPESKPEDPVLTEVGPEDSQDPAPVENAVPQAPPTPLPIVEPGRAHLFVVTDDTLFMMDERFTLEMEDRERQRGPERTIRYPHLLHPDGQVQRLLNERIAAFAAAQDQPTPASEGGGTSCGAPLATRYIVSLTCTTETMIGDRDDGEVKKEALLLAIGDGGVREIALAELFLPGTDFQAIARQACEDERRDYDDNHCNDAEHTRIALDDTGLEITYYNRFIEMGQALEEEITVAYDELADRLLATGPLAASLDRAGLTTRTVEAGASAAAPAPGVASWAVMPMGSFADLAAAWAALPAEQRANVVRAGSFLVGTNEAAARAAATTLGTQASQVTAPPPGGTFVVVTTRREMPLQSQPDRDADAILQIARGTLLVTTESPSAEGERFLPVAVHAELFGYIDRRQLDDANVCLPDLGPFLETLPEAARTSARVRTMRHALAEGDWGRATYVTRIDNQSHVEVRRVEAGCTVDRSLARFTRRGTVQSVGLTRTAQRGGEPLIVTITDEPSVSLHRFGSPEPAWFRVLGAGDRIETSVREADAWYPIVVERTSGDPVRLTWGESGPIASAP
jgi:hypothetical protein